MEDKCIVCKIENKTGRSKYCVVCRWEAMVSSHRRKRAIRKGKTTEERNRTMLEKYQSTIEV